MQDSSSFGSSSRVSSRNDSPRLPMTLSANLTDDIWRERTKEGREGSEEGRDLVEMS